MTPVIITVNGTGDPAPWDTTGFAGMLGSLVGQTNPWNVVANMLCGTEPPVPPYTWQPIGYPAAVSNMEASFMDAYGQVVAALGGPASESYGDAPVFPDGPFVLSGYSQGACATDLVWSRAIYPSDGVLHNRINDCMAVCNFGDVFRCPGISNGNVYQGIPVPGDEDGSVTGGIGGPAWDLTEEESTYVNPANPLKQPVIMSWNLPGDLYGSSPTGAAGEVGESIMNIVFTTDFVNVLKLVKDLGHPIGTVEEIINAMTFFGAGTNAPHWQYGNQGCVASAAQYLTALAAALPDGTVS
jgi:hypothetical protein